MTLTHEVVYGPTTKTRYTLTAERLHVVTDGLGGANADIPLDGIEGFFVASRRVTVAGPRGAIVAASQTIAQAQDELIVVWRSAGKRKKSVFHLDATAESFQRLLAELASRRPEANLCRLSPQAAHERLGIWSLEKKVKIGVIALVVILLLGGMVIVASNPNTRTRGSLLDHDMGDVNTPHARIDGSRGRVYVADASQTSAITTLVEITNTIEIEHPAGPAFARLW